MKRNNLICCAVLACCFLIGAGGRPASAKCAAGEVWGDLGGRPASQPSLLTKAARRLKSVELRRKKPKHCEPKATSQ